MRASKSCAPKGVPGCRRFLLLTCLTAIAIGWTPVWAQNSDTFGRNRTSRLQSSLRGTVLAGKRPVAGASVSIRDLMGAMVATTATDGSGSFDIEGLAPGQYVVTARDGLEQVQSSVSVTPLRTDVELRMPARESSAAGSPTVSARALAFPAKAYDAVADAQRALAKQDVNKAEEKLEKALKIAPNFPSALTLRAALRVTSGDLDSALADLDGAIRVDPHFPAAYFLMATVYNMQQRFPDAERSAQSGLRLDSRAWQGYYELAKARLGMGQAGPALQAVDRALEVLPGPYPSAHLVRAKALIQLTRYDEGAGELETYLNLDPAASNAAQVKEVLARLRAANIASK